MIRRVVFAEYAVGVEGQQCVFREGFDDAGFSEWMAWCSRVRWKESFMSALVPFEIRGS